VVPHQVTSQFLAGRRLVRFAAIDSTNIEAQRRYGAGERGPLWLWSLAQSHGKGRLAGRAWVSEPGNLYSTYLVTSAAPTRFLSQASFVAGLAVVDAIDRLGGGKLEVALKWPNDVLVAGRKVSGILIESLGGSDADGWTLAIGCGINLAHAPDNVRYPAIALADCGVSVNPEVALPVYAEALEGRLAQWDGGRGFAAIRRDWLAHGPPQCSALVADTGREQLSGRFAGLGAGGALRLALAGGAIREIHAGDVEPVRHGEEMA
jgi:BirA family biotin operon repressor/biotin-[acetyl-CoA-carboxylase] ligase